MNKIALALLLITSMCYATEWKELRSNPALNDSSTKIDVNSLVQKGEYRKAWIMVNFDQPQTSPSVSFPYRSSMQLTYFDCKAKKSAYTEAVFYRGSHGQGESFVVDFPLEMIPIPAKSLREMPLNFACSQSLR
jgi:hypothetical protein